MLEYLFGAASFLPHGVCLLWRPDLVAIHVLSDIAVFAAYTSIAVMVFLFVSKRPEFKLDGVSTLFGMFVMGCGITHLAGAVTLWWPAYGLQGLIKLMVAIISVTAAIAVWRLMPALLAVPSGEDLRRQNDRLEREISERKRIETELRAKQDELVAALKRAEVADRSRATFLAAMSHDLRTPLNAIIGFADVLSLGVAGALATPKQQEYVEDICYSAQNLRGLIEDLLDVTKLENGIMALTPKQIPVNGLIEATMNEQRWVAEKENVALVYLPDPAAEAETRVMADHAALQRMLGNLISNALKFSPEGSAVTVRIEERSAETRIVVEDEGPGFPKGRLEDMKQPFVRGDDVVRRGCGLGLSIVDVLMLAHGGALDLQNRPEGGACVALVFPHVVARTNIEQFTPRKETASSSAPKSLQVQFS